MTVTYGPGHRGEGTSKVQKGGAIVEIVFPETGELRARRVVSRSRARPTGKYPGFKTGRMMQWESHNELNAFRLLDAYPSVTGFHEQPLAVRFLMDGEIHTHYPDLLVEFGTSKELWEIKPLREAIKPDVAARTRILKADLPSWGYAYRMMTGEELARRPRLSTVTDLLRFGRKAVNEGAREQVRRILLVAPYIHWGSATNGDLGPHGRSVLSRLALEGVLIVDIDQSLTASTQFSWRRSPSDGCSPL